MNIDLNLCELWSIKCGLNELIALTREGKMRGGKDAVLEYEDIIEKVNKAMKDTNEELRKEKEKR